MTFNDLLYRLAHWKTWDWRVKYVLILPTWFWYCLRSRAIWFFTPSNPSLSFGGFDGQGKMEMYKQLPPGSYPKTVLVTASSDFSCVSRQFEESQLHFPIAVKPDVGKMGLMFRKICTWAELAHYHQTMPVDYLLQEYIDFPIEVSVFYFRIPGETKGQITGFIRKDYMTVTGDGHSTLEELINRYPHARFRLQELWMKHQSKLKHIMKKGEEFHLSYALNLSRGSRLVSLGNEKDDQLLQVFDQLNQHSTNLFYGRYDIKCASIEDLKKGKNFYILEFNGSGGEPHHVYAEQNSLFKACIVLAQHWAILYQISRANRFRGVPYWEFNKGLRFLLAARKHNKMLEKLDRQFPAA